MASVNSPEEYIQGFPHKTLPQIDGEPTYASIRLLHKKLSANASTISTTEGGGAHGYLALCLTPAAYASHSLIAFVPPINPGNSPVFPQRATSAQLATTKALHDENLRKWQEYNALMQALKNQLIKAVDEVYLKAIQHPITEYTSLTLITMLQHLYDTYGKITEERLEKNREEMTATYDVAVPIDNLFTRIEECVDFADAARSPYSQAQILSISFLIIQKTGLFNKECRKWRKKDPADKTWALFKAHFREAYDDYKEDLQMNTAGSAFNAGAVSTVDETVPQVQDSLQHLAAATAADRTAVANLTSANSKLSQELQAKTATFTALQKSLELVQKQLSDLQLQTQARNSQPQLQPQQTVYTNPPAPPVWQSNAPQQPRQQNFHRASNRGRGRGRFRGRGRNYGYQTYNTGQQTFPQQQSTTLQPYQQQQQYNGQSYCWTHGVTNNPSHTSYTCRNPAHGHQSTATMANTMGGNPHGLPY